jgi:hypothetical protein
VNYEILDKSYVKKIAVPVNYDKIGNKHNDTDVSKIPNLMVKKSDTTNMQHRLIMLGDSHLKGVATNVKSLLKITSKCVVLSNQDPILFLC